MHLILFCFLEFTLSCTRLQACQVFHEQTSVGRCQTGFHSWSGLYSDWVFRHPVDACFKKSMVFFLTMCYTSKLFSWANPVAHFGCPLFHILSLSSIEAPLGEGEVNWEGMSETMAEASLLLVFPVRFSFSLSLVKATQKRPLQRRQISSCFPWLFSRKNEIPLGLWIQILQFWEDFFRSLS